MSLSTLKVTDLYLTQFVYLKKMAIFRFWCTCILFPSAFHVCDVNSCTQQLSCLLQSNNIIQDMKYVLVEICACIIIFMCVFIAEWINNFYIIIVLSMRKLKSSNAFLILEHIHEIHVFLNIVIYLFLTW